MNMKIKDLEKVIENFKNNESVMSRSPSREYSCHGGSFLDRSIFS